MANVTPRVQILVIESDPAALEATVLLLEAWGLVAFGIASANEDLRGVQPDLVILDHGPWVNGMDTVESVRSAWGDEVPVLALSYWSYQMPEFTYVLSKPVEPALLRTTITKLLESVATSP